MGQEEESAKRLKDFAGYQVTNELLKRGGAASDALFTRLREKSERKTDQVSVVMTLAFLTASAGSLV
jgi:ornithine carbamoyltransferase